MIEQIKNSLRAAAAFALAIIALGASAHISAQSDDNFSGGIFTSDAAYSVNVNHYASASEVYLNGGPKNDNGGAALPDGTYYFQVTTPSGNVLLSTDNARCRQVDVVGGRIYKMAAIVDTYAECTPGALRNNEMGASPFNGSWSVHLAPFAETTNQGGEYKAWLIRYTCKTTGPKNNPVITECTAPNATDPRVLDNIRSAKTDNFKIKEKDDECTDCATNVTISGMKFYDANNNHLRDMTEAGVGGFKIELTLNVGTPDETIEIILTNADGSWSKVVPRGTTYSVREIAPPIPSPIAYPYWRQTAPEADSDGLRGYAGTATNDIADRDFGNICFDKPSGGFTLGFWSNKNGSAIMKANDNYAGALAFLTALNLRNTNISSSSPNGSHFDPSNYSTFRTWLLNGNAVSMAYMLSVQLSATSLDVRYYSTNPAFGLNDNQIVDGTSVGAGIETINAVRLSANTSLGTNAGAFTLSGNPVRQDQEIMKNFLDGVNNNRLGFACPGPCAGNPYPPEIVVVP